MTKHTPVPWTLASSIADHAWVVSPPGGGAIATVPYGSGKEAATLIAAAPDLLAALRRTVEGMSIHMPGASALYDARAAIAKAEGK